MIGLNFKLQMDPKPLQKAVDKGAYRSFSHAAASIRKAGQVRIVNRPKLSAPKPQRRRTKGGKRKRRRGHQIAAPAGHSPYTTKGAYRNAIVFDASKTGAVIGPRFSRIGTSGEAQEHGGRYKGANYPQRPTMGPALSENLSRFKNSFAGAVG